MPKKKKISDFEEWDPKQYLKQYYSEGFVTDDEVGIFKFLIDFFKNTDTRFLSCLDVGCGPTIHHIIPLAPFVEKIYLADYFVSNLKEIKSWIKKESHAHDWSTHIKDGLAFELAMEGKMITEEAMEGRARLIRRKITSLLECDIFKKRPIDLKKTFPLVTSFFCVDSVASSKESWKSGMSNLSSLVSKNGWLLLSSLKNSSGYKVGDKWFPGANIDENDLKQCLEECGFLPETIEVEVVPVEMWSEAGFKSIIVAKAKK